MSGVFRMGKRTQLKVEVVHKLSLNQLDLKQAKLLLGVSERTLWRYLAKQKKNPLFFVHANRGRSPRNKLSPELKAHIQDLVKKPSQSDKS